MTKKEAIQLLTNYERTACKTCTLHQCPTRCKLLEAVQLAIRALHAYRDCRHCTHNVKIGHMRGCELGDCDFEEGANDES